MLIVKYYENKFIYMYVNYTDISIIYYYTIIINSNLFVETKAYMVLLFTDFM